MLVKNLIPQIFYDHITDGIDFFVYGLGCKLLHHDGGFAIVEREGAKAYLIESPEFAAKDRPQLNVDTGDIHALYAEISVRRPDLLHPNSKTVQKRAEGWLQFAMRDKTDVCIIFRQFD